MAATWTATHLDLSLCGIAPQAMVPDARALAAIYLRDLVATTFELPGHGFAGALAPAGPERVRFGAPNGVQLDSAIDPLVYYIVSVAPGDPDFFTLADPNTGAALILTGDGTGTPSILENIIPKIDLVMARWTSAVVAQAKAYRAPWTVPPAWAPLLIAQLAAPTVCKILRVAVARFEVPDVQADYERAQVQFDDLKNGVPMDDGVGPVDADTIANDAMRATNRTVQTGCPAPNWNAGVL